MRISRRAGSVRRSTTAAAVALAGGLLLSSCGTELRPGTAATVDGTNISQSKVDDMVEAACNYLHVQNAGNAQGEPLTVKDARANVAGAFVAFELVGDASDDLGLTIRPSDVETIAAQSTVPDELDERDTELLTDFFYSSAKAQLQQAVIGAHLKSSGVTSSEGVSLDSVRDSDDYIRDYFRDADVDINPLYGTWDGTNVTAGSGSLSDPVSDRAKALSPTEEEQAPIGDPTPPVASEPEVPANQMCG